MTFIYSRIVLLCDQYKTNFYTLEKTLGFSKNSIQKWEHSIPGCDKVLKLANYFDVSVDYLLGNTDNPQSHKNDPSKLVPAVTDFKRMIDKLADVSNDAQKLLTTYQLQADLPDGASSKKKSNE